MKLNTTLASPLNSTKLKFQIFTDPWKKPFLQEIRKIAKQNRTKYYIIHTHFLHRTDQNVFLINDRFTIIDVTVKMRILSNFL